MPETYSKKRSAIDQIFNRVSAGRPDAPVYLFDNNQMKAITKKLDFSNQFDATKFDSDEKLPNSLRGKYYIIHLGGKGGKHAFIKGVGYHKFEPITKMKKWSKSESMMDNISNSEASIVSQIYNQKIIHDFAGLNPNDMLLFHQSRRAKTEYDYYYSKSAPPLKVKIQVEIDGFYESKDTIITVEVKNAVHPDFEIRQLYSTMKYFELLRKEKAIPSHYSIRYLFVVGDRTKTNIVSIKIYEYKFADARNANSLKLIRACEYQIPK